MYVGRVIKETNDIREVTIDLTWWLDSGELIGILNILPITLTALNSVSLNTGTWQLIEDVSEPPVVLSPPPPDTTPLTIVQANIVSGGTKVSVLLASGTPGLAYTASVMVASNLTMRQKELDILVFVIPSATALSLSPPPLTIPFPPVLNISSLTASGAIQAGTLNVSGVAQVGSLTVAGGGPFPGTISKLKDRVFVGASLTDPASLQDYISLAVPFTVQGAVFSSAGVPGLGFGAVLGARASNTTPGLSSAVALIGLNDNPSGYLITNYSETRCWYNTGVATQAHESDILNCGRVAPPRNSPYAILAGGIINYWLSNGRPDVENIVIGGTVAAGNQVTITIAGSFPGAPASFTYTAIAGDTLATVAAGLAAACNANPTLQAEFLIAIAVGNVVSTTDGSGRVTGYTQVATGSITVGLGGCGNVSVGLGFINNTAPPRTGGGGYLTGILFDYLSLVGSDGQDATPGFGEAIAMGRRQGFSWYNLGNTPGSPASRIYYSGTSAVLANFDLVLADHALELHDVATDTVWFAATVGSVTTVDVGNKSAAISAAGIQLHSSGHVGPDASIAVTNGSGANNGLLFITGNTINLNGFIALASQIVGTGAATATLTNSITAGNPVEWLLVTVNGNSRHIPLWA
jgi:hypothetical protein